MVDKATKYLKDKDTSAKKRCPTGRSWALIERPYSLGQSWMDQTVNMILAPPSK
jgi:hypothetical protein